MKIKIIAEKLSDKGMPIFWQLYIALLAISSVSIIFITNIFWQDITNLLIHIFIFIGIIAAHQSHKQKSYPRLLLVNGSSLIVIAMVLRSLISLEIPISINISLLVEELGITLIAIYAYMHLLMFEKKFKIKGITVDYSLFIISCLFFFLLIIPNLLNTLVYDLSFTQQLLVTNVFIGLMFISMSIIHYLLSKSIGLTDAIRILLSIFVVIHFGFDLIISLGKVDDLVYTNGISWSIYHLAGTTAILFIFIEDLTLDFSAIAPERLGNQLTWTASIVAILAIPLGLIIRSFQSTPGLNILIIATLSIILSVTVIWRFIILIKNSNQQRRSLKLLIQTNSLTNLPNYSGYLEKIILAKLNNALVITINIEDFKAINDLFGRDAGDEVLQSLAKRLQSLPNVILVAHIHSDLFLSVFQTKRSNVQRLLKSLEEQLGVWDTIQNKKIAVPLTFGASFSEGIANPEKLAKDSEQALKNARNLHASFSIHNEKVDNKQLPRHELRHILQQAVDKTHLPVHFQPIYNLEDGSLKALELLIRVDSDEHGLLMPGQFLEQAKSYGLLTSLTQVCIKMVAKHYASLPDVIININLPPYMLKSPKLLNNFIRLFEEEELPPEKFCIEITEDGDISAKLLIPAIQKLKSHGFSIAMDDFGTGYSSLDRLSVLDVDTVKIDRSLLLSASSGNTAILECAITLAKKLGVSAVVEGVETIEQLSLVKLLGADSVQGFLFSKPLPAQDTIKVALNSNSIVIV